jgi:hypothetical protein
MKDHSLSLWRRLVFVGIRIAALNDDDEGVSGTGDDCGANRQSYDEKRSERVDYLVQVIHL